jgi:acyl-CoA synthetase (NDP forming)
MVGPNCMGLINTDPAVRLNASFTATDPPSGGVAVASQSGALGETILETAAKLGLGLSSFVSLGNKTDVSGNDLLDYWADDPRTKLILLYLESFGNPLRFAQIARRVTHGRGKPILAVKSGRSVAGAAAASSHTGSLAGADVAVDSLLHQCGVIRVNTVAQLFTVAQGFATQPIPRGRRVGILTNAGGPGIMATDAAVHFGLELAELAPATRKILRATLSPEASVRNPVDTIATAGPHEYRICATAMYDDPSVDALILIFVSPVMIDAGEVARAIVQGVRDGRHNTGADKPVLSCFMGKHHGDEGIALLRAAGIPAYQFPEAAAESLAAMARFGELRAAPTGAVPTLDPPPRPDAVRAALAGRQGWLRFPEVMAVLDAYGIPTAPWAAVASADAAVEFAEEHGYPVVLKIDSDTVLHKSEHGGVRVDLRRAQDVRGAFAEIRANLAGVAGNHGFVVQKMIEGHAEVLIGAAADPAFGHLIAFGLGGIFAELMKDVVFRVPPLTDRDARQMIESIRGYPLLEGARGGKAVAIDALCDVLHRVSRLVGDFPEIVELDLNPFFAHANPARQAAVDARMRIAPAGPPA